MKPLSVAVAERYFVTLAQAIALMHDIARVERLLRDLDDDTAAELLREAFGDPET